jgi:predicted dehydrogenase
MKTAAIIGISSYARYHLMIALEQALHGRLRLVAATIVNQREEAFFCERLRSLGCRIFDSADAMWSEFSGKVDLCFIPTGIHLHAAMTLQALRAGASVLVEKPLATTMAEAQQIMKTERESGHFVAVGFQDLYAESTWKIKELILAGGIGELRTLSITGLWPRSSAYYARNDWAGRLKCGDHWVFDSPINNAFAHFCNLALFWAGSAVAKSAQVRRVECELYRAQPIESFDTCCVRAGLSGGAQLLIYATHSCHEDRSPQMTITGASGQITWVQESHYEVTLFSGGKKRYPVPGKFETKLMMSDAVLQRFELLETRICDTAMALEHMRLVEAMHTASPIIEIAPQYLRRRSTVTGEWSEILGIEEAIDSASAQGRLWSEIGVPWAQRVVPFEPQSAQTSPYAAIGARFRQKS